MANQKKKTGGKVGRPRKAAAAVEPEVLKLSLACGGAKPEGFKASILSSARVSITSRTL